MTDNNEIAGQDLDHLLPFSTQNNYPPKPIRLDAQTQITLRGYLSIYQRINEIKKHCDTVEKDIEQDGKNWAGISLNAVMQLVRNKMIAYGVLSKITLDDSVLELTGTSSMDWVYKGVYRVQFINIDNPTDFIEFRIEGISVGDNVGVLSSWAESQAFKRAFVKTFNIIAEENEEPLVKTNEIEKEYPAIFENNSDDDKIGFDQINYISQSLCAKKITQGRLLETFEIDYLSDMKIKDYKKAIELIEKM
jgi:hypothetical protein